MKKSYIHTELSSLSYLDWWTEYGLGYNNISGCLYAVCVAYALQSKYSFVISSF